MRCCTYDDCDRKIRVNYPDSTYETWEYRDDGRVWMCLSNSFGTPMSAL